jgi:hypothetical protein
MLCDAPGVVEAMRIRQAKSPAQSLCFIFGSSAFQSYIVNVAEVRAEIEKAVNL